MRHLLRETAKGCGRGEKKKFLLAEVVRETLTVGRNLSLEMG